MERKIKHTVIGETFIVALLDDGTLVAWGDDKDGCLGLGPESVSVAEPRTIGGIHGKVIDVQYGLKHLMCMTDGGEVYVWGKNDHGQLGIGDNTSRFEPVFVESLTDETIVQICAVRNSSFALSKRGIVFGWGDNSNSQLGMGEAADIQVVRPEILQLLQGFHVRRLEVWQMRTMIAYVDTDDQEELQMIDDGPNASSDGPAPEELDIFKGVEMMRNVMEKTQEWWNFLLNIKHGEPYDLEPSTGQQQSGMELDASVKMEILSNAELHLDMLVQGAVAELKKIKDVSGTKNVKFMLAMFIDDCRLRREKVLRTISARNLVESKKQVAQISGFSVTDFGAGGAEQVKKITAADFQLQETLRQVRRIPTNDLMAQELQNSLVECLETRIILHETQIECLKAGANEPSDPILPPLRIIKNRWNALKHFSLYALYHDEEARKNAGKVAYSTDDEYLMELVKASDSKIDQIVQIDKDAIISRDSLVPSLCYDLLLENAELRKMTNAYQLRVLLLHKGKNINPATVKTKKDEPKI